MCRALVAASEWQKGRSANTCCPACSFVQCTLNLVYIFFIYIFFVINLVCMIESLRTWVYGSRLAHRVTSLIRNAHPPRTTIWPYA